MPHLPAPPLRRDRPRPYPTAAFAHEIPRRSRIHRRRPAHRAAAGTGARRHGVRHLYPQPAALGRQAPHRAGGRIMDIVDAQTRSRMMSGIKGRDTVPEVVVRRVAHRMGFRFRLYRKDLPGRPDLVFPRYRAVVFVHGCFWHRHQGCRYAYTPRTRVRFWMGKFSDNVARDRRTEQALVTLGWRILVIWECETRNEAVVRERLREYLPQTDYGTSEPAT